MLYPHVNDSELSKELFKNPGSEYRGTPFWAWNCKLEKNELLRQLEVLKEMGFGGAHMHVRTGMETPYLSDEHMELVKACVEKCRDEKMLAWLYDEDRWPSGAAGGLVTKDKKYRARYLLFTTKPIEYGKTESGEEGKLDENGLRSDKKVTVKDEDDDRLIACFDVQLDENDCLASYNMIGENEEAKGVKWYAYLELASASPWYNNQTYANTLDKATIDKFIDVTYERYLNTVGEDFGGVVPAIFTDEPQFSHKQTLAFARESTNVQLPWSDDVPETFRAAYGEDIIAHLPELLWELPNGEISIIRYHYHDHIAERFASAFADRCGKWCGEHNLMLTGHMMEEPTLRSQTAALGEAMRSYRSFQLPGIDMLCANYEFTTAKQAQSASHQYGRPGVLSELYGVTGWDYDFRGHKLQGDWQAALGITVRVPHLSWVSMKGEAKRDYPASISYQSPWWKDYSYVEDHFARVNTAMTRGKAIIKVGVIHPVESYWLHWGPSEQTQGIREQLDSQFQTLTKTLLTGNIDFDFISESLLPEQCEKGGAPLKVGVMEYDAVLVPGCETLRATTLDRLEAFKNAGGKLIFIGDAPKYEDARVSSRGYDLYARSAKATFSAESVLSSLSDVRIIDIRNDNGSRTGNLIHQLRQDGEAKWLFIAHSCDPYCKDIPRCQKIRISIKGEYSAEIYNTLDGTVAPADFTAQNGKTVVRAEMYDYDSLLIKLSKSGVQSVSLHADDKNYAKKISVPEYVTYSLEEGNVYLLDKASFALDDEDWNGEEELLIADNIMRAKLGWPGRRGHVAQPWAVKAEPITHTAHLKFMFENDIALNGIKLALEDADVAEIKLDGKPVTAKPDGWFTDKSIGCVALEAIEAGKHTIEVALPFGVRTNIEWCYLVGEFGVKMAGAHRVLTALPGKLGFDDITRQLLPHYGSNVNYIIPFECEGGHMRVTVPHFDGTAVRVQLDGKTIGDVAYPPYRIELGNVEKGSHELVLCLLGNRQNCFGPIHNADKAQRWIGPDAWRSEGAGWTDSYRLSSIGITSKPVIEAE